MKLGELEGCPEVFKDLTVVFFASWQDYEECHWCCIFDFLGELMCWEYVYSVMAEDNTVCFDPRDVSLADALLIKSEWYASAIELDLLPEDC